MNDTDYMKIALELAQKGLGFVNPNPMVGAVIVKNGRIIGKGYHRKYGELHAERNAFANCTEDCCGADLYVTLEPCCHYGKTPPCTEAIIEHQIKRVIIGSADPNPLVAGKGVQMLRQHGIEVTEGILKDQCDKLNEIFMHYITTGLPFVTVKYAMTADGKIAAYTGQSKWITSEQTRKHAQLDRLKHSAIMAGIGTVFADDPMLTCRIENGRDPVRIVCDSHLKIPINCNIIKTAKNIPTIIACCNDNTAKINALEAAVCQVLITKKMNDRVDLCQLMQQLGKQKIDSILLDGGGELNWSAFRCGIVSKVKVYIAPKILGGNSAKSPVGGIGADSPDHAFRLTDSMITKIGEDILIESRVANVHGNY
ncbi:MAG: bifunctional diaminohydroxyphosphoribosylaminopyrimidine deaminase/5-amino-6-(5-phosphoribosylamino)uracil reductase RibD [Clostridia bacterium]|nr:bifunctional diaminohydroxyphosphoribosylaminopyrimidine deaminase/5-amino-6-(5-phosphoribosylamino)uracil reductase RibD [Clostridia bacterium]